MPPSTSLVIVCAMFILLGHVIGLIGVRLSVPPSKRRPWYWFVAVSVILHMLAMLVALWLRG